MNMRPLLVINSIVVVAMAGLSAWAWQFVPDAGQFPVQWGLNGEPHRFGSKLEVLLVMPVVAAFVTALLWYLPHIDPRRANIEASAKFWNVVAVAVVALLAYLHGLFVLSAMGRTFVMIDYLLPALALMMIVLGNYLGKTRSNWFGGVRTPWSMSSEYSWEHTHRWAGRLFVISGLAALVTWPLTNATTAMTVLTASIVLTAVVAVALSYVFWRNDPSRSTDARANGGA
jgi:uncharacterized membrane protein